MELEYTKCFLEKLNKLESECVEQMEDALTQDVEITEKDILKLDKAFNLLRSINIIQEVPF